MSATSLRLQETVPGQGHKGEVYGVAYSSDGAFVLSAGWDGFLHLWETTSGVDVSSLRVGPKSLSACAFGPRNRSLLAGSIDGVLSSWDAASHELSMNVMAHIRPISSIRLSPDGQLIVTASWDKQVALRRVGNEREAKVLYGHCDIVAGTAFSLDGRRLLSWSHDGSVALWDVAAQEKIWSPDPHGDRAQGGSISPDDRWAVTASRDGELRLWDLAARSCVGSLKVQGEITGCWFLLDAESVVLVTADGWLAVLSVPSFDVRAETLTDLKVERGELAPSGAQLALGCADGQVHLVNIGGLDRATLVVAAAPRTKLRASALGRLLGNTQAVKIYACTCPSCRHESELSELPSQPFACPNCGQHLRINSPAGQMATVL